jgi:hypothetical protein
MEEAQERRSGELCVKSLRSLKKSFLLIGNTFKFFDFILEIACAFSYTID